MNEFETALQELAQRYMNDEEKGKESAIELACTFAQDVISLMFEHGFGFTYDDEEDEEEESEAIPA